MKDILATIGIGLMKLIVKLPRSTQYKIGRGLGKMLHRVSTHRRHITTTNIKHCFPELNQQETEDFVKKVFQENAIGFIETAMSWFLDPDELMKFVTVEGLEEIQHAMKREDGVLVMGAHFSTLDIGVLLAATLVDMDSIYMPNSNVVFDRVMLKSRLRYIKHMIDKDNMRAVYKSIKSGNALWFSADQDHGAEVSVFAPFFGVSAATIQTTSKLAKLANSQAFLISHHRKSDDSGYVIRFIKTPDHFPTEDTVENATIINQMLEHEIRRCPEQYMWVHRRFKTRPAGELSFYDN